jgi:hypothetical protein
VRPAGLCTTDRLRAALSALPQDAGAIHLELAGLRFIDAANAGELIAMTDRPNQPLLVLYYPPPILLRMISLLRPQIAHRCFVIAERRRRRPRATTSTDRGERGPVAEAVGPEAGG